MKKIKRVEDLPRWFNLDNYRHFQNADAKTWARAVQSIFDLRDYLDWFGSDDEKWRQRFKAQIDAGYLLEDIKETPFWMFLTPDDLRRGTQLEELPAIRPSDYGLRFPGVQSMHTTHRIMITRTVHWDTELAAIAAQPGRVKDNPKRPPFFMNILGAKSDIGQLPPDRMSGFVAVDLWLPDAVLMKSFRAWLKRARAFTGQECGRGEFGKDRFAKWYREGFIPYWILRTWAEFNDISISQPLLLEALFPGRRGGNAQNIVTLDHLRKVNIPNYEAWLSDEPFEALCAEVNMAEAGEEE